MTLTPEEQEQMNALEAKAAETAEADGTAVAIADAVGATATAVADAVDNDNSREMIAAQERAGSAEARIRELESQVQEANDRLAALAETTIVASAVSDVVEAESHVEPAPVVEEAAPAEVIEVEETETPIAQVEETPPPTPRRRSSLYGKRR